MKTFKFRRRRKLKRFLRPGRDCPRGAFLVSLDLNPGRSLTVVLADDGRRQGFMIGQSTLPGRDRDLLCE